MKCSGAFFETARLKARPRASSGLRRQGAGGMWLLWDATKATNAVREVKAWSPEVGSPLQVVTDVAVGSLDRRLPKRRLAPASGTREGWTSPTPRRDWSSFPSAQAFLRAVNRECLDDCGNVQASENRTAEVQPVRSLAWRPRSRARPGGHIILGASGGAYRSGSHAGVFFFRP
jgi:hypothetical protein